MYWRKRAESNKSKSNLRLATNCNNSLKNIPSIFTRWKITHTMAVSTLLMHNLRASSSFHQVTEKSPPNLNVNWIVPQGLNCMIPTLVLDELGNVSWATSFSSFFALPWNKIIYEFKAKVGQQNKIQAIHRVNRKIPSKDYSFMLQVTGMLCVAQHGCWRGAGG